MDDGFARQTGTLAALLTLLLRSGEGMPSPSLLASAGVLGLALYGILAIGPPVVRRLMSAPPRQAPPPPPDA